MDSGRARLFFLDKTMGGTSMDKKKATIAGVVVILIGVGAAWALGFFRGVDPAVAELQQMRDQMRDAPEADRQQLRQEFRTRMENLTDQQREAFWQAGRGEWQQFAQQRMDEFFALPQADQQRRLDEMIDQMIQRQKQRQQNPNAQNPNAQNRRGNGRGGGRNLTEAQRDQRRKERLDRFDPKMRAQFGEFRRRLDERMEQRGLPPMPGGRGMWRGGGPGRGAA
jgi:hypothetical protein